MTHLWFPQTTFRFNDPLERLTELTRTWSQAEEGTHGAESGKRQLQSFLWLWVRDPSGADMWQQTLGLPTRNIARALVSRDFHGPPAGRPAWSVAWLPATLNAISSISLPWRWTERPPWVPSLAETIRWDPRGPPGMTKTLLSQEKLDKFRGYFQIAREEGQTSLWAKSSSHSWEHSSKQIKSQPTCGLYSGAETHGD